MFQWRILIIGLLLIMAATPVSAQDALTYGEAITGEISDEVSQQAYTFFGKTHEVVVMSMIAVDVMADLDRTMLILQDPSGGTIAEYDGFGSSSMFAVLPADGDYTLIATRPEEDDSVGEYTLAVSLIQEIGLGESVSGIISSEDGAHLYLYRGDGGFYLSYTKEAGDFGPEISVNIIGDPEDGQLDTVGALLGADVERGSIGIFDGGAVYIIALDEALFSFSFSEITADYTLELLDASKLE